MNVARSNEPVYIIAEAGVNHNGNKDLAYQLIDVAVAAGADAVKFQTFRAENLVTIDADKADYQKQTTNSDETQFAMLKRLELEYDVHHELLTYCDKNGIDFLSTAFDMESLDFLVNELKLKTLKIPSGEITNAPLILAHAMTDCNLILSTGMARLSEIEAALGVLAYGLLSNNEINFMPSKKEFEKAYLSEAGQKKLNEKITILHCTSEYPAPPEEINLNAMISMKNAFGLKIGYSDHSEGIVVPIAAVSLGAGLIEKHFTLDKSFPGPDHKASLEPGELKEMVAAIRTVEKVMGTGIKGPMPSEFKNRDIVRKSIYATTDIKIGETFTEYNIGMKRPGTGISPMEYWEILGNVAERSYSKEEIIKK